MTNKNDYLIAQVKGTQKPFLAQVVQVEEDGTLMCVLEQDRRSKLRNVEVRPKEIVVNLGPTPPAGKVYNIDVSNLYRRTLHHDWWGPIHFYTKLDKETLSMFKNSLDRTAKVLDKHKLAPFTELFETEVRAKRGKYAGMYLHKPKVKHLVWYAPDWAQLDSPTMDYVIFHEMGHVVRYNGVKGGVKLRQKWLRLYQESIKPVVIPVKATTQLWTKLRQAASADPECSFSEAVKTLSSEEDKNDRALKVILKWIKQVHHVGLKELNLAWEAEDVSYLKSVWPESSIDSSDLSPVVSEYATKSMEELFAECFAFYMSKKELPDTYLSLMEKSLSYAKATVGSDAK